VTLSIEAQGTVLVARNNRRLTQLKPSSAKRGSIHTFTKASRRRLIELMARLSVRATRVSFLTLTFSGTPTAHEATRAFKAFQMRMRRKFPHVSALWRKEPQQRGAWHYHLLVFNMPYWSQKQIQYAWECCTREETSIVHIKLLRGGKRQAMYYVAKYLAKPDVRGSVFPSLDNAAYSHVSLELSEDETGRFWGWVNYKGLPFDVRRSILVDDDDLIESLWREMARLTNGRAGQQLSAARLYGTCCYDIAERLVKSAKLLLYDITHEDGTKIHWSETAQFGGMPLTALF